ncbi:MAG: hypothetical protein MJ187_04550 [Alphaproteobacteria bacterium]|nr:hypothetical protein [Alphaproteobacteria bacterium]
MKLCGNTFYHGSKNKISDGVVHAMPGFIRGMKVPVTAVFATNFTRAKLYAVMRLISSGWRTPNKDALYVQYLKQDIPEKAYVYELDSDGFLPDGEYDYYCLTDKKIKKIHEIDIMQDIESGKLKIYVLKDKLVSEPSMEEWREICKHKDKFELYNPVVKEI